ncbi:hypothetical protein K490DRAFT_53644 [Saccharata proteae CBS 121410]|uniref:Uncharacterized protein n=1 Tax=Saccharata proteae CBS 121410 TaxID=1314787 RepID=A0A9P4I065_9PEZI|nr:hypothetical protein K490DRAFT_53644 [Saccharata proteae CBS 121410]
MGLQACNEVDASQAGNDIASEADCRSCNAWNSKGTLAVIQVGSGENISQEARERGKTDPRAEVAGSALANALLALSAPRAELDERALDARAFDGAKREFAADANEAAARAELKSVATGRLEMPLDKSAGNEEIAPVPGMTEDRAPTSVGSAVIEAKSLLKIDEAARLASDPSAAVSVGFADRSRLDSAGTILAMLLTAGEARLAKLERPAVSARPVGAKTLPIRDESAAVSVGATLPKSDPTRLARSEGAALPTRELNAPESGTRNRRDIGWRDAVKGTRKGGYISRGSTSQDTSYERREDRSISWSGSYKTCQIGRCSTADERTQCACIGHS